MILISDFKYKNKFNINNCANVKKQLIIEIFDKSLNIKYESYDFRFTDVMLIVETNNGALL